MRNANQSPTYNSATIREYIEYIRSIISDEDFKIVSSLNKHSTVANHLTNINTIIQKMNDSLHKDKEYQPDDSMKNTIAKEFSGLILEINSAENNYLSSSFELNDSLAIQDKNSQLNDKENYQKEQTQYINDQYNTTPRLFKIDRSSQNSSNNQESLQSDPDYSDRGIFRFE